MSTSAQSPHPAAPASPTIPSVTAPASADAPLTAQQELFDLYGAPTAPSGPLSSDETVHPLSNATITVRVIKSFEYRTVKGLVLKGVDLGKVTVGELMENTKRDIKTAPGFKAYRTLELDTLKMYTVAHGSKTSNLIINLDKDEWILSDPSKTLAEIGAKNETELSLFNRKDYEAFKANPEVMWD